MLLAIRQIQHKRRIGPPYHTYHMYLSSRKRPADRQNPYLEGGGGPTHGDGLGGRLPTGARDKGRQSIVLGGLGGGTPQVRSIAAERLQLLLFLLAIALAID